MFKPRPTMTIARALKLAPVALAAALAAGPALALDAPLAADSHISTSLPASNFGTLPTLNVGGGSTGLLRFDLGTLPAPEVAGAVPCVTPASVQLLLTVWASIAPATPTRLT